MCGRFYVEGENENELLARMIEEASRRQEAMTGESNTATGEVFSASTIAVMAVGKSGGIGIFPMLWGFHHPDNKGQIINTRSETALEKPMFKKAMLERRCLIPCSWYFEWETRDAQQSFLENMPSLQIQPEGRSVKNKTKNQTTIKYAIRPKASGIMYLAGIYRYEEAQHLPVLSILTRETVQEISFIHDRMPVIFSDKNHSAWLDQNADPRAVMKLCETAMVYRAA